MLPCCSEWPVILLVCLLAPGTVQTIVCQSLAKQGNSQSRASPGFRPNPPPVWFAEELRSSQGQGLVAALREVPAVFFQESFELDRPEVWGLLGDVESDEGRQEAMDKLGHYLVRQGSSVVAGGQGSVPAGH